VAQLLVCGTSYIRRRYRRREPAEIDRSTRNCAIEQASVEKSNLELFRDEPANAALST
jgi:hypothetical protein